METSKFVELSKAQKIILLAASLLLALLLFFVRNGFSSDQSLDQLARNSLRPEVALNNARPTVLEFYADWCEVCQEMTPSMYHLKRDFQDKINLVLLNVDNDEWLDLIEKYDVNGIPQLNLFDADGKMIGKSIGLKSQGQINQLVYSLVYNQKLPNLLLVKEDNPSKVSFSPIPDDNYSINVGPRSHS